MSEAVQGELVPVQPTEVNPMVMINNAIVAGMDPDKMGKLYDLQMRWEKDRAAERFSEAIRQFQSKMPPIDKTNPVRDRQGNLMYKFADFSDIMAIAQPILNECGITVTFSTKVTGTQLETTCHVRVGIHVEDTSITLGLPAIPNANDAQKAGAALSYGQRYSFIAALNIRVKGQDLDGQGLEVTFIDAEQVIQLEELITATGTDIKRFLIYANVDALQKITTKFFPEAIDWLKIKAERQKQTQKPTQKAGAATKK